MPPRATERKKKRDSETVSKRPHKTSVVLKLPSRPLPSHRIPTSATYDGVSAPGFAAGAWCRRGDATSARSVGTPARRGASPGPRPVSSFVMPTQRERDEVRRSARSPGSQLERPEGTVGTPQPRGPRRRRKPGGALGPVPSATPGSALTADF